jgi:hypothetical protein
MISFNESTSAFSTLSISMAQAGCALKEISRRLSELQKFSDTKEIVYKINTYYYILNKENNNGF